MPTPSPSFVPSSVEYDFRFLTELLPQIVWISDSRGTIDYLNHHWYEYTDLPITSNLTDAWYQAFHPDDLLVFQKAWKKALKKNEAFEIEVRLVKKDRSYRWHLIKATPLPNQRKKILSWVGTCTDINDQKRSEKAQHFLSTASEILSSSLDYKITLASVAKLAVPSIADWCAINVLSEDNSTNQIAVAHTDPAKTKLALQLQQKYPSDPSSPYGIHEVIRTRKSQLTSEITEEMLDEVVEDPEVRNILKDLQLRSSLIVPLIGHQQVLGTITLILAESGRRYLEADLEMAEELAHRAALAIENATLYQEAQQEISERKQTEELILHQALHDGLTGLPNRIMLQERLAAALTRAKRKREEIAIIFLDLDRFKNINDTLGHHAGDQLLQEVARRLRSSVRGQDTVARFGGDEFTILLTGLNRKREIEKLAAKVFAALQDPVILEGQELHINVSMGIAIYPLHGENEDSLLKNADIALYHAKDQGRNNFYIYDSSLTLKASEHLQVERELRNGLANDEFAMYYQPVLDLATNQVVGAEALLRWNHPERGLLLPADFIDHAEESGLILTLGEWALTQVCQQLEQWHQEKKKPCEIALNLSTLQFSDNEFFRKLQSSIQKYHIHSHLLEIEITESIAMRNLETTIPRIKEIKKMGVNVAIDDFGIGHSSLSYLKLLPIDTIKIDKSFVQCCTTDKYDAAIIQAIIAMARSLDIKVVAEGVETKEQLHFLKRSKCQEVQGFYISQPLPLEEFTRFLQEYPHS